MPRRTARHEEISLPALLRHARLTYGDAMREALEEAGFGDVPKNGLYVLGGLALGAGDVPLGVLIRDLRLSKQSAGQLVDALVVRGYLERNPDPGDRRRLVVTLTERGRAAARAQAVARRAIDAELVDRLGERGTSALRKGLAVLVDIGRQREKEAAPR